MERENEKCAALLLSRLRGGGLLREIVLNCGDELSSQGRDLISRSVHTERLKSSSSSLVHHFRMRRRAKRLSVYLAWMFHIHNLSHE